MTSFIDFLKSYWRNPLNFFVDMLNQDKPKYTYMIICVLGLFIGLNTIMYKLFAGIDINIVTAFLMIIKKIVVTIIIIFIYSWIVQFFNGLMNGESNQRMVITVISYSLIPMTFIFIVLTILKILIFIYLGAGSFNVIFPVFYCVYLIFLLITLIYLVIGNAIAGNFAIFKSILASSIIPLIFTIFEAYGIFSKLT